MELRRKTELKNVIVQGDQRRTRKKENCESLVLNHLQKNSKWVIIAVIFDLIQYNIYPLFDEYGAEFHLGIKTNHTGARVYTLPKVHLLEEAAPTMYFRYIESPDGVFNYPLFATQEEAEYYDLNHDGRSVFTRWCNTLW